MKPSKLRPGMKYFFIAGAVDISMLKPKNALTIADISVGDNPEDVVLISESKLLPFGYLKGKDLEKVWVLINNKTMEQVEIPDGLRSIWNDQLKFNLKFFNPRTMSLAERQQKTKDFVIHLSKECYEVLDEINWKMHRNADRQICLASILEECIDVFKFLLGVMNIWEFGVEDFTKMYWAKTKKVKDRYYAENIANKR